MINRVEDDSRSGSGDLLQQVLAEADKVHEQNHQISLSVVDTRPIVCRVTYRSAKSPDANDAAEYDENMTVHKPGTKCNSLSRTRSGRISRPPSYRVRDYKVHRMVNDEDDNEDKDDDDEDPDGGYTDYDPVGDCLAEAEQLKPVEDTGPLAALGRRPKDRHCPGCDKAYTGMVGLRHHLKRFPTHNVANRDDEHHTSLQLAGLTAIGCADDANRQRTDKLTRAKAAHRKARLKSLVRTCRDDELMEVVGPRLVKAFDCWQFLLARCRRNRMEAIANGTDRGTAGVLVVPVAVGNDDNDNHVLLEDVEAQLGDVARNAERLARRCLSECTALVEHEGTSYFNVTDERAARVMGIATGTYKVKLAKNDEDDDELPEDEDDDLDSSVESRGCRLLLQRRTEDDVVVDLHDGGVRSPPAVDLLETTTSGWSLGDADKTYADTAAIQGFEILDMLEQDSLGSLQSVATSPLL